MATEPEQCTTPRKRPSSLSVNLPTTAYSDNCGPNPINNTPTPRHTCHQHTQLHAPTSTRAQSHTQIHRRSQTSRSTLDRSRHPNRSVPLENHFHCTLQIRLKHLVRTINDPTAQRTTFQTTTTISSRTSLPTIKTFAYPHPHS